MPDKGGDRWNKQPKLNNQHAPIVAMSLTKKKSRLRKIQTGSSVGKAVIRPGSIPDIDRCLVCSRRADIGVVGIFSGKVQHRIYCETHYLAIWVKRRGKSDTDE